MRLLIWLVLNSGGGDHRYATGGAICVGRLTRPQEQDLDPLLGRLAELSNSPLRAIATGLRPLLELAQRSHRSGDLPTNKLQPLVNYVAHLLKRLPQMFSARFGFDAALIAAIVEDGGPTAGFSAMLIPRYEREWGHESLMMPAEGGKSHVIDLVLIPGQDQVSDIDLLSYPWLGHELAHNLLFRHDTVFRVNVLREMEKQVQRLKLGGMADKGPAQAKANRIVEDFVQFWTPTPDHKNWSHELAADLVALWIFGPAYLACFEDVLDNPSLNPYQLTQSHPAYVVRADALLDGARLLGWHDHVTSLSKRIEGWLHSKWRQSRTNRFRALASPDMTGACVSATFSTCQDFGLTKCTPAALDAISRNVSLTSSQNFGISLLLEAYVVFRQHGEQGYVGWQSAVVPELADSLKL
jgi:hypothetical protein